MRTIPPDAAAFTPAGSVPSSGTVSYSVITSLDGTQSIEIGNSGSAIRLNSVSSKFEVADAAINIQVNTAQIGNITDVLTIWQTDFEWLNNTTGPVVHDTVDNSRWRIVVTSGVLTIQAA